VNQKQEPPMRPEDFFKRHGLPDDTLEGIEEPLMTDEQVMTAASQLAAHPDETLRMVAWMAFRVLEQERLKRAILALLRSSR
jgi:hypothetical protein